MPSQSSSSRTWIVAAVVTLLTAATIWWVFGRGGGTTQTEDTAATRERSQEGKSPRARPRLPELGPEARATVSGTVRRQDGGAGIAAAQVCAWPEFSDLQGVARPDPECTRSDSDGSYVIGGLLAVRHRVVASAPEFKPKAHEFEREDGEDTQIIVLVAGIEKSGVDIELEAGGVKVEGIVTDIAGGEIEGALVSLQKGRWGSSNAVPTVTNAEGRFEAWVEPGDINVKASAEGYADDSERAIAPGEFVEVELVPESVLVGLVVHAQTGEPVSGVKVTASSGRWWSSSRSAAVTNDEGHFRIDRLSPGRYKPEAKAADLYGLAAEEVNLGLGQTSESVIIEAHPAVSVEGRIVIASAEPRTCLAGSVTLREKNASKREHHSEQDPEGVIRIDALIPGTYEVGVNCTNYVAEDRYEDLVLESSRADLEWAVREGLSIRGHVVDSEGRAVSEDISVYAQMKGGDPRGQRSDSYERVEDDGSFELNGLIAGTYTVRMWGRPGPDDPVEVEVESGKDTTGVRIELPATGTITGFVADERGEAVSGVTIRARLLEEKGNGGWKSTRTNDAGSFELEEVRVGRNRVVAQEGWSNQLRAPGTDDDDIQGETTDVTAGGTAEVRLVVRRHDEKISGTVVDENGMPLADAFVSASREKESAATNQKSKAAGARWGSWSADPVLADQDGHFEIDGLEEGTYGVYAHREGGGEGVVTGVSTGTTGVEVVIETTADMSGSVTIVGGGAPERFRVSVVDEAQGVYENDNFFRTKGAWSITHLPPGVYEVKVTAAEGDAKQEDVKLEDGRDKTGVNLELDPKVHLIGRLVDADTREPVPGLKVGVGSGFSMGGPQMGDRKEISDASGHFEIPEASSGETNLVVAPLNFADREYDFVWKPMDIAASPPTQDLGDIEVFKNRLQPNEQAGDLGYKTKDNDPDVEPEEVRHQVAFVRPGGPAAAAGLEVGAEITSVDGHDVTGRNGGRIRTLTRVPTGTKVVLGLKEGAKVEIVAGPPK